MISLVLVIALISGCASTGTASDRAEPEGTIKVTTTIAQIADAVKNIGGEYVEVTSLMGPGVDPHLYQATQGDITKLDEADIIFYNGLHLEGKMNEIFEKISKEKPTHAIGESIPQEYLKTNEADPDQFDPHIWFDISLWKIATEQVRDGLIDADPSHADEYKQNTEKYMQTLDELHVYAKEQIASIPKESRLLITAHDAFNYFGGAYDLEVMGLQGLSTDSEYGLRDVHELVDVVIERNIKAVFVETSIANRSIQAVIEGAKSKGHDISIGGELFSDAMGEEGTPEGTYLGMFKHNVDTVADALK